MEVAKSIFRRLPVPRVLRGLRACLAILAFDYGMARSLRIQAPVDRDGQPLPWYTFPAIDYLKQLDLESKSIFEYGAGFSTLFWRKRARRVVSVEDDPGWYKRITADLGPDAEVILAQDRDAYVNALTHYPRFDIVVVDGSYRLECARVATQYLASGGMILLDNADSYADVVRVLNEASLIQVDMRGFGPANPFVWTTSLFLHPAFQFRHRALGWGEQGGRPVSTR